MSKALLYDSTICIGCKQCEQACATQNNLAYDDAIAAEEFQSAHKLTCIQTRGDKFMRRLCMNCQEPSCASVCPVGALKKTALGPVTYDASKCMGCRYCMVACPFSVPKYEWGKLIPKVQKCVMCPDRVAQGKQTACAEICPTGATKFGERDDIDRRGPAANSRQPGQLRRSHLRSRGSRRHIGAAAIGGSIRDIRIPHRHFQGSAADADLPDSVAHP